MFIQSQCATRYVKKENNQGKKYLHLKVPEKILRVFRLALKPSFDWGSRLFCKLVPQSRGGGAEGLSPPSTPGLFLGYAGGFMRKLYLKFYWNFFKVGGYSSHGCKG